MVRKSSWMPRVWVYNLEGLPMSAIPFLLTAEAAAWILEKALIVRGEQPHLATYVPVLWYYFSAECADEDGHVFERCSAPFFDICWLHPDKLTLQQHIEINIADIKVVLALDTLKRLNGKRLVMETVEVGVPVPSERTRQLLRAVPDEGR